MIKKILNPFDIQVTSPGTLYVILGCVTSAVLHMAFYATLFHFIRKVW